MVGAKRFEVWLINLDPTVGSEIKKTRPAVVISPDEMNRHLKTLIIVPMTSSIRKYPSRVAIEFKGKLGEVALDQLRCIDRSRIVKKWGQIKEKEAKAICRKLGDMFAY